MDIPISKLPKPEFNTLTIHKHKKKETPLKKHKYLDSLLSREFKHKYFNKK